MFPNEPKFHVVFRYDATLNDYIIAGIFTQRQDAELLKFDLKKARFHSVARMELTFTAISEYFRQDWKNNREVAIEKLEKIQQEMEVDNDNSSRATASGDR